MSWLIESPRPVPSPAGFVVKKGFEHLLLNLRRDAGSVVANSDLYAVTEVIGGRSQSGFIGVLSFALTFSRRVKSVGDQVKQNPAYFLRIQICLSGVPIERALYGDVEALLLRPGTMVGKVQALLDERIDLDRPLLAGTFARVKQHVFYNGIGAFAVLRDLVEILTQRCGQFSYFIMSLSVQPDPVQSILQLIDQFDGYPGKIIDEVEWILDLMRDASRELAKRRELMCLYQAVLRITKVSSDVASSRVRTSTLSNKRTFSIAIAAWSAKVIARSICFSVKRRTSLRVNANTPMGTPSRIMGTPIAV